MELVSTQLVSIFMASFKEVSDYYLNLNVYPGVAEIYLVVFRNGEEIELPMDKDPILYMQHKATCRQLTACKTMQVLKMKAKHGYIARPRKIRNLAS